MLLDKEKDLLVIIDMINGFTYQGAFASDNVVKIIKPMASFVQEAINNGIQVIHYIDNHPEDALEFQVYPKHCTGDEESLPVKELDFKEIEIIHKNSTNGFFAKNPFVYEKNLYIIGCVTDICIFEYALTCQKYKEHHNLPYSVNVIEKYTATFDGPDHDAKVIQKQFIELLKSRGINII